MITGLIAYVVAQTGLTVQPPPAPANLAEYPVVTYQVASYATDYTNEGAINVASARVIFNAFSTTYLQASNMAQLILSVLSGYTGTLTDGTHIFDSTIVGIEDQYVDASQTLYRTSVHTMIQYAG